MLQEMLSLEQSTADSPDPPKNANMFYIRTFMMRVRDIRSVFQAMLHDGYDNNPRIFAWMERIESHDVSDNQYLTLRYCGQSRNKPWDRHVSDIYSKSLKTFLAQFLKTLSMICPDVLSSSSIHTVIMATSTVPLGADILDIREQVLISLFGDSVLNTEVGGKDVIVLTEDDQTLFDALRTNTVADLKRTKPCSSRTLDQLRVYAKEVCHYANENSSTTLGKSSRRMTARTEQMLIDQGTPTCLRDGSAVMVTLGSNLGDDHDDEEESFFKAGGRSADAVSLVYNHFGHWEAGTMRQSYDHGMTHSLAKLHHLPFADVFPWFTKHRDDYKAASQFTCAYMKAVRPMVVSSYGSMVSFPCCIHSCQLLILPSPHSPH